MEIKEFVYNDIPIVVINTSKFKTIVGKLYFKEKIKKEMMLTRRMVRNLLMHSSLKYPSSEKLNMNVLENYNPSYNASTMREGNYIINCFSFNILEDKYTEDGNFNKALDTFKEIVFNPNALNGEFDSEEYNLMYKSLEGYLKSKIERPRNYVIDELCRRLGSESPISYMPEEEDLKKTTKKSLYKDYEEMINNSQKKLIIAGNITDDVYDSCKSILDNLKQKDFDYPLIIENDISSKVEDEIEEYNGMQSILSVGLKLDKLTMFERLYVVPLYNGILGGGASSRLFDVIREKNSLAYFCFSRYERDDSLIYILSGIEKDNYEKTYDLMKKVLASMKEVKEEEIKRVKEEIISSLKESDDYLSSYPGSYYFNQLYGISSKKELIENINKVTKSDIEKIYNKLHLSNSYFLKGVGNNEEDKN